MFEQFIHITNKGAICRNVTYRNINLTIDEKLECVEIANHLLRLSVLSYQEGLLPVFLESKKIGHKLLIKSAEYVSNEATRAGHILENTKKNLSLEEQKNIDAVDFIFETINTDLTFKLIYNLIASSSLTDKELFESYLIMDGMLCIQIGMHVSQLRAILMSYFGIDLQSEVESLLENY